ncbi:MAG: tRNA pseudouridine(55) synthase TruB [Bdellovibrionales bacterium]
MKRLDGLLLLDKPKGITSHDLVDQVRRLFGMKDVGHSGTLDPMASGLMVILLGQATKLSPFVMDGDKRYSVEVLLGRRYDTLDVTGQLLSKSDVTSEQIAKIPQAVGALQGDFEWPVPIFSAVKIQGQKLYEHARNATRPTVEIPKKPMKFWDVTLKSDPGVTFWVDLRCSKGSFIRTWVDELGQALGCGAAMQSLVRSESQPFSLEQALSLSETETLWKQGLTLRNFVPMAWALPHFKKVRVQNFDQTLLLNGQISHDLRRQLIGLVDPDVSCWIQAVSTRDENLLAILAYEAGQGFKIKRVLATKPNPNSSSP